MSPTKTTTEPPSAQPDTAKARRESRDGSREGDTPDQAPMLDPAALRPDMVLDLQRTAGNEATTAVVNSVRRTEIKLQRDAADLPDLRMATRKAVAMVNKKKVAFSVPITSPPGVKVFRHLELKSVTGGLSVTFQLTPPPPAPKPKPASATSIKVTNEQAELYAAQLESKMNSTPLGTMLTFKASAKGGKEYNPTDAMELKDRAFSGDLNVTIGDKDIPVSVSFTPLSYDGSKGGREAWKFLTVELEVKHTFDHKLAQPISIGDDQIAGVLKVTPNIKITLGPEEASAARALAELYPQEARSLLKAASSSIAEREARIAESNLIDKLVQEQLADFANNPKYAELFADAAVSEQLRIRTREAVTSAAAAQGLDKKLTTIAEQEMARLLSNPSSSFVDLYELATVRKAVQTELTKQVAFKESLQKISLIAIRKSVKEFSLKKFAEKIALELAGGPVDIVLIAIEAIYGWLDTLFKAQEIKQMELRTMAVRDNYVAGYVEGMRGAAGGGSGGTGNIEGTALMMGKQDGRAQFDKRVSGSMDPSADFTLPEAETAVKDRMVSLPVGTAWIISLASSKLQQMMLKAFEEKYSGGVMRTLFGHDLKGTKDYEYFSMIIGNVLGKGTKNRTYANLIDDGVPTGVQVPLIGLDSVGLQTTKWRTVDGRYRVVRERSGRYSGWQTEQGQPLEEIFTGDATPASDDTGYVNTQITKARMCGVSLSGKYYGTTFKAQHASLTGEPTDLDFREFKRTAEFQGMKLSEFAAVSFFGDQTWTEEFYEGLDDDVTLTFRAELAGPTARSFKWPPDLGDVGLTQNSWEQDTAAQFANWAKSRRIAELPMKM